MKEAGPLQNYDEQMDEPWLKECELIPEFYGIVFLDVDSCLTRIEGIDMLGEMHGKTDEIKKLTNLAMNGEVPLDEVFARRLSLIRPRQEDLEVVAREYIRTITQDAPEVIKALRSLGVDVRLISGGYDTAIFPLATHLGIPQTFVHANRLFFDKNGDYKGFDENNPLSKQGGKKTVIEHLRQDKSIWSLVAIVGDAVSELETKPATDFRVGFGGHVKRERVEDEADVFIKDPSFATLLPLMLDGHNIREIIDYMPDQRGILRRGLEGIRRVEFNIRARGLREYLDRIGRRIPEAAFDPSYPVKEVWKGY